MTIKIHLVNHYLAPCFSLLLLATGCAVQQPKQIDETPTVVAENPINQLLTEAKLAFKKNQLTTPSDSSAYRFYMDALKIDPKNEKALLGINNIVEQYLSWALAKADIGDYDRARQYLQHARSIDRSHPNIQPVLLSIKEQEQAKIKEFDIDPERLEARRVSKMVLRRIAQEIIDNNTFVTIQAPDDASGRWLYRELNDRVDFRIQAAFKINKKPRIYLSH